MLNCIIAVKHTEQKKYEMLFYSLIWCYITTCFNNNLNFLRPDHVHIKCSSPHDHKTLQWSQNWLVFISEPVENSQSIIFLPKSFSWNGLTGSCILHVKHFLTSLVLIPNVCNPYLSWDFCLQLLYSDWFHPNFFPCEWTLLTVIKSMPNIVYCFLYAMLILLAINNATFFAIELHRIYNP